MRHAFMIAYFSYNMFTSVLCHPKLDHDKGLMKVIPLENELACNHHINL